MSLCGGTRSEVGPELGRAIRVSGVIGSMTDSKSVGQGSSPWGRANNGPVAQLVERWIEDPSVGGSNPSRSTKKQSI